MCNISNINKYIYYLSQERLNQVQLKYIYYLSQERLNQVNICYDLYVQTHSSTHLIQTAPTM